MDPDQARHNAGPDLYPKLFDTLKAFLKELFEKVDFEKEKSMKNYPGGQS